MDETWKASKKETGNPSSSHGLRRSVSQRTASSSKSSLPRSSSLRTPSSSSHVNAQSSSYSLTRNSSSKNNVGASSSGDGGAGPSSSSSKIGRKYSNLAKEQKARFYIMRRCVAMLVCWHKHGD